MWEIGWATDPGIKRKKQPNQDSVGVLLPSFFNRKPPLLIIADGMGGYEGGALASKIVTKAINAVYQKFRLQRCSFDEILLQGVQIALADIRKQGKKEGPSFRMGSTVVAAILDNENLYLVNVGDSRAYLFNSTDIRQISYDHSVVADLVRNGTLSLDQIRAHPDRSKLTLSLNTVREIVAPFSTTVKFENSDVLVLCSDGLWASVSDTQIQEIVLTLQPQKAAMKLVTMANINQGLDNISVIIARRKGYEEFDSAN
jgi:PPM family protein phosphatase